MIQRKQLLLLLFGYYYCNCTVLASDVLLLAREVLAAQGPLMDQTEQGLLQLDRQQAAWNELQQQELDQVTADGMIDKELNNLIVKINSRQVQELIEKLKTIHDKEMARRAWEKQLAFGVNAQDDDDDDDNNEEAEQLNDDDNRNVAEYTAEELEQILDPEALLEPVEPTLAEWIRLIMEEELNQLQPPATRKSKNFSSRSEECVTHAEAAQQVQQALVRYQQDGIGWYDHASLAHSKSRIVHEMTSPTYQPPPTGQGMDLLLGDDKIRKYIPQDWEQFVLPDGWQEWSVRKTLLPDTLFHSLGLPGATTAPPETIIHPNTLPGSCWPMDGRTGKITIQLPYPVRLQAVTVDHVSPKLLLQGPEQRNSAPRNMKLYAFPPCREQDDHHHSCAGLSFDPAKMFHLMDVEYNIQGPPVQTFPMQTAATTTDDSASCSAVTHTCSGTNDSNAIQAIQVQIVNNWGKEEYTCMYRFRVHGEAIQ